VWSGFYDAGDVNEMIDDILEEDADEKMLRAAVPEEFARKAAAEKSWPAETDCDRLDAGFELLNAEGIIALQNAGYTMSDGISDVSEVLYERGEEGIAGYCFFHGQDFERVLNGEGLNLAFGDRFDNPADKAAIGKRVQEVLETKGFVIDWNGDPEKRLHIPQFDWKRRSAKSRE
jgi:hypothetical protein